MKIRFAILMLFGVIPWIQVSEIPAQQAPDLAGIEGIVRDADTGAPLSGVLVAESQNARVITGVDGRFEIEGISPGRNTVGASKRGYVSRKLRFTFEQGQHIKDFQFQMRVDGSGGGVITGRVYDLKGSPVVGTMVGLFEYGYVRLSSIDGREVRPQLQSLDISPQTTNHVTNDRGEFRLFSVPPGKYVVAVSGCNTPTVLPGQPFPIPCSWTLGGVFYPSATDPRKAVVVEVNSGEETKLGDIVVPPPIGKIRAHLVDDTGSNRPLSSFAVRFRYMGAMMGVPVFTGYAYPTNGVVELSVNFPGVYAIDTDLNKPDQVVVDFTGADLDVVVNTSGRRSKASAEHSINGRVLVEPADSIGSDRTLKDLSGIRMVFAGDSQTLKTPIWIALTTADGMLKIPAMPEGIYRFIGFGDSGITDYYLVRATQGTRDVLKSGVAVNEMAIPLEFVLSPLGGVVQGTVYDKDNLSVHNAVIALIPESPISVRTDRADTYRTERTDQNGVFEIRGLVPGSYRVYAWYDSDVALPHPFQTGSDPTLRYDSSFKSAVEDGAFMDPEFMKSFDAFGKSVIVAKGGRVKIDLKIIQ